MRSIENQLVTRVAFGQRSSTWGRLPVWSMSSWDRKIQRTSLGSTMPNTVSSHADRVTAGPQSTIIGSAPVITIELTCMATGFRPSPKSWRITKVSGAIWAGSSMRAGMSMAVPPGWSVDGSVGMTQLSHGPLDGGLDVDRARRAEAFQVGPKCPSRP